MVTVRRAVPRAEDADHVPRTLGASHLPRSRAAAADRDHPEAVDGFAHDLRQAGVGAASIQKALVVLQGAMKKAVLWGRIPSNPVSAVSKAPKLRRSAIEVPSPRQVEAIRQCLGHRDATLVSVLAYAGLRPGEALALRWDDVRERTLLVDAQGRL